MKPLLTKLLLAATLLSSCSQMQLLQSDPKPSGSVDLSLKDKGKEEQKLMIYTASVYVEANHPDSIQQSVADIAKKYNGYVLTSGAATTTIRIAAGSLRAALTDIAGKGRITNQLITSSDVTEEFIDYNTRLENAEKTRQRFLELLNKAKAVEDILKVEKELERLNGEIEVLKGKMNRIDHLVDYATITVYHNEKLKLGILGYAVVGVYKSVKWLFVRN